MTENHTKFGKNLRASKEKPLQKQRVPENKIPLGPSRRLPASLGRKKRPKKPAAVAKRHLAALLRKRKALGGKNPTPGMLRAVGLFTYIPTTWITAKDCIPPMHKKALSKVSAAAYTKLQKALSLARKPVLLIDRDDPEAQRALKCLEGYCGVYRWVHKPTNSIYVGGTRSLRKRLLRHKSGTMPKLQALIDADGLSSFYIAILWIAGRSDEVDSLNVYQVEITYFLRQIPQDLALNTVGVIKTNRDIPAKERIGDPNEPGVAEKVGPQFRRHWIGVRLARYVTDEEKSSPNGVQGDPNEVEYFKSIIRRVKWLGYAGSTVGLRKKLLSSPPLVHSLITGYKYLITQYKK